MPYQQIYIRQPRTKTNNKFGAIPTMYHDHGYDSKLEAGYAQELELRQKAGEIREWRPHVLLHLKTYGQKFCDYEIDFEVEYKDNTIEYVEVKSIATATPQWKKNWRVLENLLTHIETCHKTACICREDWPFPVPWVLRHNVTIKLAMQQNTWRQWKKSK
jgi:hypothetical protein